MMIRPLPLAMAAVMIWLNKIRCLNGTQRPPDMTVAKVCGKYFQTSGGNCSSMNRS